MMSPAVSHVHWWEIPHTLSGTYSECRQFYLPASTPHLSSANTRSAGFSRLLHGKFTNSNRYYSTRRKNGVLVRPYPILTRTSARAIYFLFFLFLHAKLSKGSNPCTPPCPTPSGRDAGPDNQVRDVQDPDARTLRSLIKKRGKRMNQTTVMIAELYCWPVKIKTACLIS